MVLKNQYITFLLRFIVGVVFIISAISKLNPIEPFEFRLIETGLYSWSYVTYIARGIIGLEFFLGFGLLLNIRPKLINFISINLLIIFSLYLSWFLYKYGNDGDCGCFGNYFQMKPLSSLYKNIGMIGILTLFKNFELIEFKLLKHNIAVLLLLIASTSYSFIVDPPLSFFKPTPITIDNPNELTFKDFGQFDQESNTTDTSYKIICMFSLDCKYCKLGAQKISLLDNEKTVSLPIYYVFGNKAKENRTQRLHTFYKESHSNTEYPVSFMETKKFLSITKGQFPLFIILKNNKFQEIINLDQLKKERINNYLTQ